MIETTCAVIATVRDRADNQIGHFAAIPADDDLSITLHLDQPDRATLPKDKLDFLADHRITMLLNGVLRFTTQDNTTTETIYLDQFVANASGGQLRLVYNHDGIKQALHLLEHIWV